MTKVIEERAVFYRERASATYRTWAYLLSLIMAEIPYILTTSLLFTYVSYLNVKCSIEFFSLPLMLSFALIIFRVPLYFISGLQYEADKWFIFYSIYLLTNLLSLSISHNIALVAPNLVFSNAVIGISYTIFALFNGFLIIKDEIPGWWIWMYYLDVNMYPLEAYVVNELDGLKLHCSGSEALEIPIRQLGEGVTKSYCSITSGEQFMETFNMEYDHLWRNSLIMIGFVIFLILSSALLLKFLKHQKR